MARNLPQKLYVQYMPDDAALSTLVGLQSRLANHVGTGRMVPADQLHVTVLHFGFIEETFTQLQAVTDELSRSSYKRAVQTFIDRLWPQLPAHCELAIQQLDAFGPHGTVAVLILKSDLAFIDAYEKTMQQLGTFASELGINAVADIPAQPRALQVPTDMTPHIALIKQVKDINVAAIDMQAYAGQTLQFRLFDTHAD